MSSVNLSSYTREDLTDILRILKLYKTSYGQIGRRARMRDPRIQSLPLVRVEYPSGSQLDGIRSFATQSLKKFFSIENPQNILFEEKNALVGGIRLFVDDDMMDVSFSRFAN